MRSSTSVSEPKSYTHPQMKTEFDSHCKNNEPQFRILPDQANMKILVASDQHAKQWNNFIAAHPAGVNYLRWQWKYVVERAFGWRTFYLLAEESGEIFGVLPLVWQNSRLFGKFTFLDAIFQ